ENLKKQGYLDDINIIICNVGSRKIGEQDDYASSSWGYFAPNLTIYGFDADADACDAANQDLAARNINWKEIHVPLALADKAGEMPLYVTKHPMCSSLYPPNEELLARFAGLPELVNLDFEVEIETTTLDDFCEEEKIERIDFLQVDVQGADLAVLKGGQKILNSVSLIQIEVEFSELYKGQPLFAQVDQYLRERGFILMDLQLARRSRALSPVVSNKHPGQPLWGEAFYIRDRVSDSGKACNLNELFKLACIADAGDFIDYALEILVILTIQSSKEGEYNFSDLILESLVKKANVKLSDLKKHRIYSEIVEFASDKCIELLDV
ncbi:FkbM family methyltransferase, partial [Synechococcales cyanobacterium C]